MDNEVPKLGKEAAEKAIEEWRQPKSNITHLIFGTNSDYDLPGTDLQLVKLLGLEPSVKRSLLRLGGCHASGTALRIAKDIAENNRGARVLVVCSDTTAISFHAPSDMIHLVPHAIFGDGAGAIILGADPDEFTERPIFQLVSTGQTILPDSERVILGRVGETGMFVELISEVPKIIAKNIKKFLIESCKNDGINDWNSIFLVVRPGGRAILDQIEAELGLEKGKLNARRHVLSEYGNMWGASVIFVLDEMRKSSLKKGKTTTGEGLDWGVLLAFGPGITVETIVLHSVPIKI